MNADKRLIGTITTNEHTGDIPDPVTALRLVVKALHTRLKERTCELYSLD